MSKWRSVKAKQLLAALLRIGWELAWQKGSHRRLKRLGWPNYTLAFHDNRSRRLKRPPGIKMIEQIPLMWLIPANLAGRNRSEIQPPDQI